ncbi:MAG: hypothetical protein L6437_10770 [Kiritimatiellae bacterium]|nr:hypothetical protein [Kiritimatiellia bacterium]
MTEYNPERITVSTKDRVILREIAKQVVALAARPGEQEKAELWQHRHTLQRTRPLIAINPQNGWIELVTPEELTCEGELAREWEEVLRREIFLGTQITHDGMVMRRFGVPYIYTETDWGVHEQKSGGENGGAYSWEAPLRDYDRDFQKLRFPEITIHESETKRLWETAQDVMADIMPVCTSTGWYWTLGVTWEAAKLRGLEQMMYDMYDHPDEFHALMAFIRDGLNAKLDFLEQNNLLASQNLDGTYEGEMLPQKGRQVRTMDLGGFAESQETVGVSPEMFETFIFPYQYSLLARFGSNHYGCCEPLDRRIHIVKRFPRLRTVTVSPWSNLAFMANQLQDHYLYFHKPHPGPLSAERLDEDLIRTTMRETFRITRNCHVLILLADTNTFGHNPNNLVRWSQIVMEEAQAV